MNEDIRRKERLLEKLSVEDEVATRNLSIAEKKRQEKEAKRAYGKDWRKIIGGALRSIKPNQEKIQDMYSMGLDGDELRDMNRPGGRRREL